MSALRDHAAPAVAAEKPSRAVLVARQPICDARPRVVGYDLILGGGDGDDGRSTAQALVDAFAGLGLEALVGGLPAHLRISRDFLLEVGVPPLRPDRVVLEVDAALASDADAVAVLRGLAFKGYAIAVRAAREVATIEPLLEFAGIVGLDAGELGDAELGALAEALRERPVTLLARGLDTHEAFARCRELGFHRFQGAFYERPRAVPGARVPGDRLGGLGTLARLVGRGVGFERLEQIVTGDLGLGYKLLRYVNSAFFGLAREVHTVGEALVILGEREVKRWAMVMALAAGPGVPRELTVLSLSRGRMCESFGSGDERLVPEELFTVGMFSVVDVLLDMPLAEILDALPFAPRIEAALLRHEGPLGETLARVLAWERGEFAQAAGGDQPADLAAGYREALEWAERAGRALA